MSIGAQSPRGWSVDGWVGFWSNPSAEVALRRIPTLVTPDVTAVWPRIAGRVQGHAEYARRIVDLLALVPDLRLGLGEHAANGKFVFQCNEAYLIEDGVITAPVRGATLIGDGATALTRIQMVGDDFAFDPGVGVCGKGGQGVPVGIGQPSLKIGGLTVGGTAV